MPLFSTSYIADFLSTAILKLHQTTSFTPKQIQMPQPAKSASSAQKFELPVLAPLESLTAGTDIPPPPPSPIAEKPAPVFTAPAPLSTITNGSTPQNGTTTTISAAANGDHLSPSSPTKPSSIRRFLSRKSLNGAYNESAPPTPTSASADSKYKRPESSLSMASTKKRSSWWRRMLDGGSDEKRRKRTSTVLEENEKEKKGPPPPRLPELETFGVKAEGGEGLGGGDLFRDIK